MSIEHFRSGILDLTESKLIPDCEKKLHPWALSACGIKPITYVFFSCRFELQAIWITQVQLSGLCKIDNENSIRFDDQISKEQA